jgi:FkbM family methyltransferase
MINTVRNYFEPFSILDIGANIGQFYSDALKIVPNSYFYLIEANELCEVSLKSLGVDYSISVLSNCIKEVDFFTTSADPTCTGNSLYRELTSFFSDEKVKPVRKVTNTLDGMFYNHNVFNRFDLIKIDTQGSELDILIGGKKLVSNSLGVILETSVKEYNSKAPNQIEIFEYMNSIGFEKKELLGVNMNPDNHELVHEDYLFINRNIL